MFYLIRQKCNFHVFKFSQFFYDFRRNFTFEDDKTELLSKLCSNHVCFSPSSIQFMMNIVFNFRETTGFRPPEFQNQKNTKNEHFQNVLSHPAV